jgi:hypothetical protein
MKLVTAIASVLLASPFALACAQPSTRPAASPEAQPALAKRAGSESSIAQPIIESSIRDPEPQPLVLECPEEMTQVARAQGFYCIDRWEASLVRVTADRRESIYPHNRAIDGIEAQVRAVSVAGRRPQGYISGVQAERVCRQSKKRLCEVDEWVIACRGSRLTRYPYGDRRKANVCNDRFKVLDHHPVPIIFKKHAPPGADAKLMWHPSWMNDPRLLQLPHTTVPSGSLEGCTNDYGVYDMVGNLHEWVDDPAGTFMGGFFMDTFQNGEGCEYRTTGHGFEYHDYSTGFRCCADPAPRAEPK